MYDPARYSAPAPSPGPRRQGMAIASLVISIVSLVTCGGVCIGPILGLIFGIVAFRRAGRDPATFGGKEMAIAGIVISLVSPILMVVWVAIAAPNLLKSRQAANEASAISTLRTIGTAEATYQSTEGKDKYFADFRALAAGNFIGGDLASGQKSGYRFTATALEDADGEPIFDTTAIPLTTGNFGTGNRSFGSNETYVIYWAEGAALIKGTPANRVPMGASPLSVNNFEVGPLATLEGLAPRTVAAAWNNYLLNSRYVTNR
jgi:hypothetical protein